MAKQSYSRIADGSLSINVQRERVVKVGSASSWLFFFPEIPELDKILVSETPRR